MAPVEPLRKLLLAMRQSDLLRLRAIEDYLKLKRTFEPKRKRKGKGQTDGD